MKAMKLGWVFGWSLCMGIPVLAEPVPVEERVMVEEVPEVRLELKDLPDAEEQMILDALGLVKGRDGQLEMAGAIEPLERELEKEREAGKPAERPVRRGLRGQKPRIHAMPPGGAGPDRPFERLRDWRMAGPVEERAEPESRWMIGARIHPNADGVLVVQGVLEGSPAEQAGLRVGDEVLTVNGIRLRNFKMLTDLVQLVQDQQLVFQVRRGEGKKRFKVTAKRQAAVLPEREAPVVEKLEAPAKPEGSLRRELRALQEELLRLKKRVKALEN